MDVHYTTLRIYIFFCIQCRRPEVCYIVVVVVVISVAVVVPVPKVADVISCEPLAAAARTICCT